MVGRIDVDADDDLSLTRVDCCADRTEGLGEHDRGATVKEAIGLGVSLDGHGAHHAISGCLKQFHSHFLAQGTHRDHFHQFVKVYWLAHARHHD